MLQMLKRNLTECDSQQTPLFFHNIIICHNSDDGGGFLDFGRIMALLQVLIKHSACPGTWSYCLRNELELRKFILSGQPVTGVSEIFHWICVFFNCSIWRLCTDFPSSELVRGLANCVLRLGFEVVHVLAAYVAFTHRFEIQRYWAIPTRF